MKTFKIRHNLIGNNSPIFIIAEAGINHIGSFNEAKRLVDVAMVSAVDAITFQHIHWDDINCQRIENTNYNFDWDNWCLSNDEMSQLFKRAHSYDLAVTACVADIKPLEFVVNAGADFIKVVSGDLTYHPFLVECSKTGLPILLSTGNALINEIEEAVNVIERAGGSKIVIYQTNSKYPTPAAEVNLRSLELLSKFGYPIGFCDHTKGSVISLAASAVGARVIEKHISLDPTLVRPDSEVSLSPVELEQFVLDIRTIEKALGKPIKKRYSSNNSYLLARRSVVSKRNISSGEQLSINDLDFKRPGTGIPPSQVNTVIGKVLICDMKKGEQIKSDMVD